MTEPSDRERFIDDRLAQLEKLLGKRLGGDLDPGKRARIRQIMVAAGGKQFDLVNAADRGELAADVYLDRFTELLRSTFVDIDRVLGRADFERVFGAGPEHALGIVDPEAYAAARGLAGPSAGGKDDR